MIVSLNINLAASNTSASSFPNQSFPVNSISTFSTDATHLVGEICLLKSVNIDKLEKQSLIMLKSN